MRDVTQILRQIEDGDSHAAEKLLPVVYDELRKLAAAKMAKEKPGQTINATGLVHEAYIRLVDTEKAQHWDSRGHFFAAAAEAIRRILIDRARQKAIQKGGGNWTQIDFERLDPITSVTPSQLLLIDEAITQLSAEDPLASQLVALRYFGGFSVCEAAAALGICSTKAYDHWAFARAFIRCQLLERS